jgi:uncharacterized membrane protein YjdF
MRQQSITQSSHGGIPSLRSRLLLGDWGPVVRDPLDVLRILYVAGATAWVVLSGAAWDGLVGASLVILAARLLNLPRAFDLALIVAMALTGWGSALHFYGNWGPYDNVVHLLFPLFIVPVAYILLVRLGVLPELRDLQQPHHQLGFFLIAFAIGMAFGGGWEVIEWVLDQLTGEHRVKDAADTANDLISTVFGSAGAGLTLIVWSRRGWGCRRLPAHVVRERLTERRLARRPSGHRSRDRLSKAPRLAE